MPNPVPPWEGRNTGSKDSLRQVKFYGVAFFAEQPLHFDAAGDSLSDLFQFRVQLHTVTFHSANYYYVWTKFASNGNEAIDLVLVNL